MRAPLTCTTPALVVDADVLESNLATMARRWPGATLRPHVKAHKTTALAHRQAAHGHPGFTCATIREVEGMAAAGLGTDLLLANEVLDTRRLGALVEAGARVTVAVDSPETVGRRGRRRRARGARRRERRAAALRDRPGGGRAARRRWRAPAGLEVRGVMGYEGHLQALPDLAERARLTEECMALLLAAHADVGGEIVSGGGTGTSAVNTWVTEMQAGSYALMDSAYTAAGVGYGQALHVLGTVVSVSPPRGGCPGTRSPTSGSRPSGWTTATRRSPGAARCGSAPTSTSRSVPTSPSGWVTACSSSPPTSTRRSRCTNGCTWCEADEVLETWPVDLRGW